MHSSSLRSTLSIAALVGALVMAALAACSSDPAESGAQASASVATAASGRPNPAAPHDPLKAPERAGGAIRRSADGARLYLADEDHKALRILAIPFAEEPIDPGASPSASASAAAEDSASPPPSSRPGASASASASAKPPTGPPPPGSIPTYPPPPSAKQIEVAMPGAPAQVLPMDGRVLVTIRDPGLLLVMKETADETLVEEARVPLAADAWGIALSPDEKTAIVTSAWTHTVTGVDLEKHAVRWTVDVAREPRGVVVHPDGVRAYVSHLTSGDLTRIQGIGESAPTATVVSFPAAPSRTPLATRLEGSLGYALVIDDAGHRLLAARHALGGLAEQAWFGIPTIDVLQTADDTPLLSPRVPDKRIKETPAFSESRRWSIETFGENLEGPQAYQLRQFTSPVLTQPQIVQPRAMIVAKKSQVVFVASEGDDSVGEFPLTAAAPIELPLRTIGVGRYYRDVHVLGSYYGEGDGVASQCGAPTGLALSADESLLYVYCRSTNDVATVRLSTARSADSWARGKATPSITIARVATETGDETFSRGRRLFYGARDGVSSGGMGCAGCHPEGRDDGHVWHEVFPEKEKGNPFFLATKNLAFKTKEGRLGYPRQTPMLAGRVNAAGPYGWHAQNDSLRTRLAEGFGLHRWNGGDDSGPDWILGERGNAYAAFLRGGLVTPPRPSGTLTQKQQTGKQLFESAATECTKCHVPATDLTNRIPYDVKLGAALPGFEEEEDQKFKTPSLLFVGGTAPYFHDGRVSTLAQLIAQNRDRMGKTTHLSADDQAALVAYLETL